VTAVLVHATRCMHIVHCHMLLPHWHMDTSSTSVGSLPTVLGEFNQRMNEASTVGRSAAGTLLAIVAMLWPIMHACVKVL
jgi:hypothetical protein